VPLGTADVKRAGSDVTIVAVGRMVLHALKAAATLAAEGIEAEIVDPRTLVPLDLDALVASVCKTNRALVVDGGVRQYGVGAEIAASLAEAAFDWLDAPVARLCGENVPIPISRSLEPLVQPSPAAIVDAVRRLMTGAKPQSAS
jgi:pyruvate dehydrogenase E1 component beta subunit